MKKIKKIVIFAVVIIAIVSAIVVKNKMPLNAKKLNVSTVVNKTSVEVQTTKTAEKNLGDTYKATLEAYQQGTVTSKLGAKIVSVPVENGQYVNAGDIIATLDDQDIQNNIKTAQAQIDVYEKQVNSSQVSLEKLKINVDDAQHNYDRQKTLFDSKAISQTDLEAAEKALNSAKADYDSGNASIDTANANLEAQKVTLEKNQSDLANTVIKAPISGVISNESMNVGQMASSGTALATVNDISSVYATIQVPQEKISSIKIGQVATIAVDGSDETYNGTVQYMDSTADTTSRVFNVKVKIDNSDKSLLPGVYGTVTLVSEQTTDVITVPVNALVGSEDDYSVFVNNNGKAVKTKVTIGKTDENNVEITDGIKDGEQVICTNTATLHDGDEIEVVSSEDNSKEETLDQNGDNAELSSK
ncbi:efflux RND transporter periplasmic adaptor subunit [uncultured Clostridium sp.]|uniref:efflux RND transporter periplasmic adaptor subunit n=1 Tax=uncultured Clostridium sp. TaxID=59620 RepID=UPI0028E4BBD3|nr:efflux RND transporter periplasmic adaptor subunit [uncultured Clostridium sp.]